jgi:hypothetical protein
MKIKLIIIFLSFSFSTLSANPIVVAVGKEIIIKAPKIIPKIVPLLATITELGAEEVTEPMSKKKLDLYKTKF